jgi:hypothetical protein
MTHRISMIVRMPESATTPPEFGNQITWKRVLGWLALAVQVALAAVFLGAIVVGLLLIVAPA